MTFRIEGRVDTTIEIVKEEVRKGQVFTSQ
jgi:hypothetical protein